VSARSFKRSHAQRLAKERRRLSNAKRRALVAGATLGAAAAFATSAEAATYTVTNTDDSGAGSLRQAITDANTNGVAGTPDTITFASGVTGSIGLTSGTLTISDPGGLSIEGPGASTLSVSGAGQAGQGIFDIVAGGSADVSISGLTLTGGSTSDSGGAIADESSPLTLTDDTISGNTDTGDGAGGVYAHNPVTVSGSTISGNTSPTGEGGGIGVLNIPGATKYNLTISDSTISGNSAEAGGGILSDGIVSITDSQLTSNQATERGGGGLYLEFGSLSLTGSTVANNSSAGDGGGLFVGSKYGMTIDGSTISSNSSADGGGAYIFGQVGEGSPQSPILVENSTVSNNQAPRGGGIDIGEVEGNAPVTISASTISGNQGGASSFGGGLLISGELDTPFDLVDSTITGNSAANGGGVSIGYGGSTSAVVGTSGSISFDNSTIDGNNASTYGGGIYLAQYSTGSPATDQSATAAINSTIVAGNTDPGAPNDLYRPSTSTTGGFNDTFSLIQAPGNAPLLSSQALITGVDPQLNALANNGGPTETLLPKNTSPVIDQGKAQSGLTTDQRGDPRTVDNGKTRPPGGDGTDIGAVELGKIPSTPPPPPPPPGAISVAVGPATGIKDKSATLNGSINTNGQAVTWHFQYGTSTAYGKVTTTESISTGHGTVPVSFKVSGLKPGTRYHYRVVATGASGQPVTSADATFKTPAPTIKVHPGSVRAASAVRIFGSAGACSRGSQVTLISGVFSSAHKFHGRNAIHTKVGAGNKYSVVTRIPAGRDPGSYTITGRCDGAVFGVTAALRILPPPPVVRFTA